MGKYIGPDNTYGLFEKQKITILSEVFDYTLNYRAPTAAGLLVVAHGVVLEPNTDYSLVDGGTKINLAVGIAEQFETGEGVEPGSPLGEIFVVFLGKQLSVTNSQILNQVLIQATAPVTNNTLDTEHELAPGRVQVFREGALLRHGSANDYTLSGTTIVFAAGVLSAGDKIDVYLNHV